jgi:hypothetical protein
VIHDCKVLTSIHPPCKSIPVAPSWGETTIILTPTTTIVEWGDRRCAFSHDERTDRTQMMEQAAYALWEWFHPYPPGHRRNYFHGRDAHFGWQRRFQRFLVQKCETVAKG